MKQILRTESGNGHRGAFETAAAVEFRWVRLVSFDAAEKLFSLRILPNSAWWVRFMRFFGHRFLDGPKAEKAKHEGTKEEEDTKTRRRFISARGARKCVISLCLRVFVVGIDACVWSRSILVEKSRQKSPGGCADRFHKISFARSEYEHKAEQFSHEQIWQKPERALGWRPRIMKTRNPFCRKWFMRISIRDKGPI